MALDCSGHTLFYAPFISTAMTIDPQWLDTSGHMDPTYYHILFSRGASEAFSCVGLGSGYAERHGMSVVASEAHVLNVRKLARSACVQVTVHILNIDEKSIHHFLELRHAGEGWLAATSENMALHVHIANDQIAPFPDVILANLAVMKASHGRMRTPKAVGRVIGLGPFCETGEDMPMSGGGAQH